MYLRSLTLKNVKRFRDLTLGFERPHGSPRLWTVVIGENTSTPCLLATLKTCGT